MKTMTPDQIANKKDYIRKQLSSGNGNYATLFIRTYYYILSCCRKNKQDWCYGSEANDTKVARYAYAAIGDGRPDHIGRDIIDRIKQELRAMGYITFKLVDDTWRIYVNRNLDFLDCDIEDLISDASDTTKQHRA